MTLKQIAGLGKELVAFLRLFADCFLRQAGRELLRVYVQGQLSELRRKSAETIEGKKGDAALCFRCGHGGGTVFRGRPRARSVQSKPRRPATRFCQVGEPNGQPRRIDSRTALTSASVCAAFT